ncbi:MAG: hypothetical protein LZF86_140105 [Nitrospira sp.]|nr:MAG: hypothetical protein LZF86_140105 [Nitrospira sp.]
MDVFQNYPVAFFVTVVLPIVSGIVLAVGGYDSLKARSDSDAQLGRIEKNTEQALKQMPDVTATLSSLARYESTLAAAGKRDEALTAVLAQYQGMKRASDVWDRLRASGNHEEKARLASEVLDILSKNLIKVAVPENLPSRPLILVLGTNTFRVLFSAPMRIPPQLEFQSLPEGVQAEVTEKSEFGFTVRFMPATTPVTIFEFTADAEL